jgi:hypothetical protein
MKKTFPTPKALDLTVRNAAGTIAVTASDTAESTVEVLPIDSSSEAAEAAEHTTVELSGDRLSVEVPERRGLLGFRTHKVAVRVTVPTGSSVVTKAA